MRSALRYFALAPALALVLVLSACATPTGASAGGGPPLTDGLYVVNGACPGEGCQLGAWIATRPGELRASADANAPLTARVEEGEHVDALGSVLRVKPVRGEVVRDHQGLIVGDVVYRLHYEGEGFFNVWRRGEVLTWSSSEDEGAVRWDDTEEDKNNPRAGWWVRIRSAQGHEGWSRSDGFECRPIASDPSHCQLM